MSESIDRLVTDHMDYACKTAKWMVYNYKLAIELEDAIQVAYVGLVEASQRFKPGDSPTISETGVPFKSYAAFRIRGAIIDECRRLTFVKRSGIDRGDKVFFQSLDVAFTQSVEYSTRFELADTAGDPDHVIDVQNALNKLTDRERHVILGLACGITGRELAVEYGVTESRISQIATVARQQIKEMV